MTKKTNIEKEILSAYNISLHLRELLSHQKSLVEYNVSKSLYAYAETYIADIEGVYFKTFPDDDLLGSIFRSPLNGKANIILNNLLNHEKDDVRLGFTSGHEIGHVILKHRIQSADELRNSDLYKDTNHNEMLANSFSGALVLPFDVLSAQILENFTVNVICHFSGVSKTLVKYRILNALERRFSIPETESLYIIDEYFHCQTKMQVSNSLLKILFNEYFRMLPDKRISWLKYSDYIPAGNAIAEYVVPTYFKNRHIM